MLIPGIHEVSDITQQIIDRSNIPYLRTSSHTTGKLYRTINEDVYKLQAEDKEKIDMIEKLAEARLDFDKLDELFSD